MSNPTSNFGWQMPTNTDLVSQLPADFEVFGQAVDTSLADLKGGTTGQVLKKNSNTDMDFVWGTAVTLGPTFYAYLSSNQTVTSGVVTKVQCNTEEYDLGSNYDNATNYRFTPTTAGIYQINALIQANGSSGTTIWIYKNGSTIREGSRTAGAGAPMGFSTQVTMNGSTDYIEFFAQVASGTTIYGGQATTGFGAAYLRSN
jgi:hypothetical protein